MTEAEVKGQRFNRIAEVMRDLSPPDAYGRLVESVTAETLHHIKRPPPATSWLPARHFDNLLCTALPVLYGGDMSRMYEQGRQSFIRDVRSVYRFFIRLASPEHVIKRASQIFTIYYRNNGTLRVIEQQKNAVVLRYEEVVIGSPAFWEQSRGSIAGSLEATGEKDVRVQVTDGGGKERSCTLRATWR